MRLAEEFKSLFNKTIAQLPHSSELELSRIRTISRKVDIHFDPKLVTIDPKHVPGWLYSV